MGESGITIRPLAGALGAQVSGVDLAGELDDALVARLRAALLEHLVLFFRDQHLTPAAHAAFGRRFGELNVHPYIAGLDEQPEVMAFVKEAHEHGYNLGGSWHSDMTFAERPSMGSILYAVEVPPHGGDTLFANMVLAYEALSDGLKAMLSGLRCVHAASASYGAGGRLDRNRGRGQGAMRIAVDVERSEVVHPVVRTHPETGRRLLYVNRHFGVRFEGMSEEESGPLLEYLARHATRPEFTCRFRWEPGSVAFWDNRATQHLAVNDYHGHRRRMHRVTIEGDVPR